MFSISKILAPVEFSDRCRGALRYAEALASRFGAALTVLHVPFRPYAAYGGPEAATYFSTPDLMEEVLPEAKARLEQFVREELPGVSVAVEVVPGEPAHKIVEYAHANAVDLIAMPTHGHGPFRRFLLGSVTAKVLHDADCPVWTGPHLEGAPKPESIEFRKVLCAVDLGPQSRAILEWGAGIAQHYGAQLAITHAIPGTTLRVDAVYLDPDWRTQLADAARRAIADLREGLGIHAESHIVLGDPPTALRQAAQELNADLLVIGRGHHSGVLGRLRANAYAIIRDSPCPVASV